MLCNFAVRQVMVERQRHHLAVHAFERRHAPGQCLRVTAHLQCLDGGRLWILKSIHDVAIKLFRVDFNRDVAAPEVVESLVPDDGRHPGHRCGKMTLITGGIVPDRDKALL